MTAISIGLVVAFLSSAAIAQTSHPVAGYYRSNGTYVAPHYQTNPNGTTADNWSTKGNVNPYTGQPGTRNPMPSPYNQSPTFRSSSVFAAPIPRAAPTYGSSYGQPPQDSSFGNTPDPNEPPPE